MAVSYEMYIGLNNTWTPAELQVPSAMSPSSPRDLTLSGSGTAVTSGMPTKVVGEWQSVFTSDPPTLQALVDRPANQRPNLVELAAAQSGGSGGTLNFPNGNGSVVNKTMIDNAKAAGIKVTLLMGAAGFEGTCLTASDRDQMIASTKTIVDTYGLQGVGWNMEGGSSQWNKDRAFEVIQGLRTHYGPGFIITAAPRPYEIRSSSDFYRQFLVALSDANLLDCAFLQFYDSTQWSTRSFLVSQGSSDLNGLISAGIPANKLGIACITQPGYSLGGATVADYQALYDAVPGLRGFQHWWTKWGASVSTPYVSSMRTKVGI